MQKRNLPVVLTITLLTVLPACAEPEPETVEVTREVEVQQTVEVTRIVEQEVEVTREVEVEVEEPEVEVAEPEEQLIGPAVFLVGVDIAPGTYRIEGENLGYVRRLSCLEGTADCRLSNDRLDRMGYVTVLESDMALQVTAYGDTEAIVTKVE